MVSCTEVSADAGELTATGFACATAWLAAMESAATSANVDQTLVEN
jgi:hypothetical protein